VLLHWASCSWALSFGTAEPAVSVQTCMARLCRDVLLWQLGVVKYLECVRLLVSEVVIISLSSNFPAK
jgi:hypothetical protein